MPTSTDPTRVARRCAIAFGAFALLAIGAGIVLDPSFAASHMSSDGSLQPYTRSWLGIYRGVAFALAAIAAILAILFFERAERLGAWLASRARLLRRGALALVAAVIALGALEIALRTIDARRPANRAAHDFEAAARDFMRQVAPQINAHGFRDDAFDRQRAAGERRILVVGDSFAFGFGVPDGDATLCAQLERELATRGAFDVFNAGVPGADSAREKDVLASWKDRVDPDLVLVAWYVNDAESEADKQAYVQQSRLIPLVSDALLRHSALWRRVEPALVALVAKCGMKSSYVDHIRGLYDVPSGARWTQRAAFAGLLTQAREGGSRVAVVLFPAVEDFDDYALADVHAVVQRACDEQGVAWVDLREAFRGTPATAIQSSALDHHLNALGCAMAAHAVAEFLAKRELLAAR